MFDLLISGGQVIDGTGAPPLRADVAVRAGRIAAVGRLDGARTARRIDARDLVVAPGFIDIHAHDDYNLPVNPTAPAKVAQGVTTTVVGNCGWSPAPLSPTHRDAYVSASSFLDSGLSWAWDSFAEYLAAMPALAVNYCQLVGHVAVRTAVMGIEDRAPSARERDRMRALVEAAMAAGAAGFSTGLTYAPSCFADTDEVVDLAAVSGACGGIYATHHRGGNVFEAVEEAIAIGRRSGAPVQVSHLKLARMPTWGRTAELLQRLDAARAEGLDVLCDQYPYVAGSSGLKNHMPHWVQNGGDTALLERLHDSDLRRRISREMEAAMGSGEHVLSGWDRVAIAWSTSHPELTGVSVEAAATRLGCAPAEAYFQVLLDDRLSTLSIDYVMHEEDVRAIMRHPATLIGSDGIFRGVAGCPDPGRPHPRHFGTFPRVLGHYCRQLGLLDLATAVHKMTGAPARRLRLVARGEVREGFVADLTCFDPVTVRDCATYADPQRAPVGIELVVNGGVVVAEAGRLVGATPAGLVRPGIAP